MTANQTDRTRWIALYVLCVGMRVRVRGAPRAGAGARRQPRNEPGARAERRAARARPSEDGDG